MYPLLRSLKNRTFMCKADIRNPLRYLLMNAVASRSAFKKAGCLLTIGLEFPVVAVCSFDFLIDQFLQLIHKGTDSFKLSVYRREAYVRHRIQILQMFHNDLSDLGTADLTVF